MDRSRLKEWLTVATNIAVLAGIVILAIEIRQNSAALRTNVLQAVASESSPLNLALATDATMRETWIQGLSAPESLTESQKLQFNVTLHVWFSNAQNWYYQMQNGVLDEEVADGQWTTMATMHHLFAGFRHYWESRGYSYTPAFRSFVETEVFTRQPLDYVPNPFDGESLFTSETVAIADHLDRIYGLSTANGTVEAMTENQLRFFADQPTVQPPDQAAIVGRAAVTEFYRNIFEMGIEFVDISYAELSIVVQGNLATRRYVGTGVYKLAEEAEPQTAENQYFDVLTKENGEWKTLLHSWEIANHE